MSTENKSQNEWAKRELGALWKRESATQKYLSGHVKLDDGMGGEETHQVIIFANKHKQKDNQPDFRIYKSQPMAGKVARSADYAKDAEQKVGTSEEVTEVQEVPEDVL